MALGQNDNDDDPLAARFSKLSPRGEGQRPRQKSLDNDDDQGDRKDVRVTPSSSSSPSPTVEQLIRDFEAEADSQALRKEDILEADVLLREGREALEEIRGGREAGVEGKVNPRFIVEGEDEEEEADHGLDEQTSENDELQAILDDLESVNEESPEGYGKGEQENHDESDASKQAEGEDCDDHNLRSRLESLGINVPPQKNDTQQEGIESLFPSAPTGVFPTTSSSGVQQDFSFFPSAPSNDPSASPQQEEHTPSSLSADRLNEGDDPAADEWCIICCADAEVQCLGCDGDFYCRRCWMEGHLGDSAGYEERGHRVKVFERRKKRREREGGRRMVAA